MEIKKITTDCCIVGGGPCGIMLGYLLARRGIDVVVLEKHKDFFRDFRGDTIHPTTMEIMHELGILTEFLKIPHDKVRRVEADINGKKLKIADFSHLKVHEPYIAFMPQWDFLNFLSKKANEFPTFKLMMGTSFEELKKQNGKVVGVFAKDSKKNYEIDARLTIAADGRHSPVREQTNLKVINTGTPIDVLWFRVKRNQSDPKAVVARVENGKMMVMLDRTNYWQCAYIIPKSHFEEIKKDGIIRFRQSLLNAASFLGNRVEEVGNWDEVKLLTVTVDHLEKWYQDGLLCIGDAAHAMSPIGGVGVNLAIQDAVAAANILGPMLLQDTVIGIKELSKVQKRREFSTAVVQKLQTIIQNKLIKRFLNSKQAINPPPFMRTINKFKLLQRLPAQIIGIGVFPEHVKF